MRKMERKEKWATAATMSVLAEHEVMKARLGKPPTREAIAQALGLKSKSIIQEHLDKLVTGELIEKGRRGVITITPFGAVMLERYNSRGKVE